MQSLNWSVVSTPARLVVEALELRIRLSRRVPKVPLPQLLEELTPALPPTPLVTLSELGRALRVVEALCRRSHLIPDTCLYRALTRYTLLRRSGYAAQFIMGMDPRPREDLTAHAWVELDGAPYRETLDARMVVTYVYPDAPTPAAASGTP